jgi:hypothetical protein
LYLVPHHCQFNPTELVWSHAERYTVATFFEMGLEWKLWKDVGGITGTGLHVCFSVLTTEQVWWYKYIFPTLRSLQQFISRKGAGIL